MTFDEVRSLELFEGLSDELLRALVDASEEVVLADGDVVWVEKQPAVFWWILLEGRIEVVRHVGRERVVMGALDQPGRWGGGWAAYDHNGVYLVTAQATTASRMLKVPVAALRALIDGVPVVRHLIDGLFHTGRDIEVSTRQREALVALGTLSAGLAHELNNPAAAATRAVDALEQTMRDVTSALRGLADCGISSDQYNALDELRQQARPRLVVSDPLAVADLEEELSTWLDGHDVDRDWVLAPALASAALDEAWCERVLGVVGPQALQPAMDWVAATVTAVTLLGEVKESMRRISGLVASVKSYSQMDRGSYQRIDVTEGLESTLVMLSHKLKQGVSIVRDYGDDVPPIDGYAGELNQVWTNLIDNAIDAMAGQGTLTLATSTADGQVSVRVGDTGSGMTPEVVERAFDTFFTTKDVGEGTGLGLNIARRVVVERHHGEISVQSTPGETVFTVTLPVNQPEVATE